MNYVYVVAQQSGVQPWKIGKTTNPEVRLKGLQTGSPVPLVYIKIVEAHPSLEASLHRQHAKYRTTGEWFHLPPDAAKDVLERLDGKPHVIQLAPTAGQKKKHRPRSPRQVSAMPPRKGPQKRPCGCGALYTCQKHR